MTNGQGAEVVRGGVEPTIRRCRAHGCTESIREDHFYCGAHLRELEQGLMHRIDRIYPEAQSIYIGRTNYPERRLLQHRAEKGLDRMMVLHWTGDREEIAKLEQRLIAKCRDRLKSLNESGQPDGHWYGHWNCLYVAWTRRIGADIAVAASFQDVTELDRGHCLVPDRSALVKKPDYLKTRLTSAEARAVLKANRRR